MKEIRNLNILEHSIIINYPNLNYALQQFLSTMFLNHPYLLCSWRIPIYYFPQPSLYILFSKPIAFEYLLQPSLYTIYWSHLFWEVFITKILENAWVVGSSPKTIKHIFERWTITTWIFKSFWHLEFELCDKLKVASRN